MLIISVLLYLVLSLLVSLRVFKHVSFAKTTAVFFLVTVTINVLVVQILSLINLLDQPWMFLVMQALMCLGFGFILYDPRNRFFKEKLPSLKFEFHKPDGWGWYLILLVSGILLLALYAGALAPINNSDSLHTHLPRIYYWIQHGSMASWDVVTVTQLNYPINIAIQGAWLVLLGGSEMLFFLVPWLALLTAVILIYEIALLLGLSTRGALVAALVGLSFPVVLLQTFSYQGDVFIATLILAVIWFLLLHIRQQQALFLHLSVVPLAVALGSKQTAFLFLPFYLLVVLLLWLKKRVTARTVYTAAGVFLASLILLTSFKYIQNAVERDRLEYSMFASYRYSIPFSQPGDGLRYATNSGRYLYQATSLDGLTGRLKLSAQNARASAFSALSGWLNLDLEVRDYISEGDEEYFSYAENPTLNEDSAWFGPLSVLLFPAAVIIVLAGKNKARKQYLWISLAFLLTVFVMVAVLITGWSPTNGRYLVLPVLVLTPLLAVLIPKKCIWSALVTFVLSIAAFFLALSTLLINDSRPLVTQQTLYSFQAKTLERWDDSGFIGGVYAKYIANRVIESLVLTTPDRKDIRHQSYYDNLFHQSTSAIPDIEFVNASVPVDAPLYLYMRKDIIEFALFGVNRTRDLVPFSGLQQVPSGSLVLVDKGRTPALAGALNLLVENDNFWIFRKP